MSQLTESVTTVLEATQLISAQNIFSQYIPNKVSVATAVYSVAAQGGDKDTTYYIPLSLPVPANAVVLKAFTDTQQTLVGTGAYVALGLNVPEDLLPPVEVGSNWNAGDVALIQNNLLSEANNFGVQVTVTGANLTSGITTIKIIFAS